MVTVGVRGAGPGSVFERKEGAPDSFAVLRGTGFCALKVLPPLLASPVMNSDELNDLASKKRFKDVFALASNFGVRKLGAGEVEKDFPELTGAPPDFISDRLKVLFGFS